jgi:nitrate/TMAO reductase-like tetraheme cytochrome c subunit
MVPLVLLAVNPVFAQAPETVGDVPDGNRSVPVHLIKLYDENDHVIKLDDSPLMPFSTRNTCGKCHGYEKIRHGWHFNAADSGSVAGRVGEPWILVDRQAAVQAPLSYRGWQGTHTPQAFGLSTLQFMAAFGRHLPGGGTGENEDAQDPQEYLRWQVSGKLEANCQSCHNADPAQSPAEYGVQVMRQNFRWAATASSGFATVQGSAAEMPDNYDLYSAVPAERSDRVPPTVHFNASRFDVSGRVLFNVVRKIPPSQCYFCHSSKVANVTGAERWEKEEDVHIAAGMICVDCHRNGVDHNMARGYEGEAGATGKRSIASLTCKGCHLGAEVDGSPPVGKRRAPAPLHIGIPPVHFDKLSCTTCHSGSWPSENTFLVKTSRAHALGIPKASKDDDALPQIATPVFAKLPDGVYAPVNMIWPAFWAYRHEGDIDPVAPAIIRPLIAGIFQKDTTRIPGRWPQLREDDIYGILSALLSRDSTRGQPVYVSGGKVYSQSDAGKLLARSQRIAGPYSWPIAHDVRPKSQSLGVRGCDDCHATDAAMFFGKVRIASPFVAQPDSVASMTGFQQQMPVYPWVLSMSFLFRPGLKAVILVSFAVVGLVVLLYGMRGLAHIIRVLAGDKQ